MVPLCDGTLHGTAIRSRDTSLPRSPAMICNVSSGGSAFKAMTQPQSISSYPHERVRGGHRVIAPLELPSAATEEATASLG